MDHPTLEKIIVSASRLLFAAEMRAFVGNVCAWVILLAVLTSGLVRGETAAPVGIAKIEFEPENGGRWGLSVAGKSVLASAPLFRVLADGVNIDHWQSAAMKQDSSDAGIRVSGPV